MIFLPVAPGKVHEVKIFADDYPAGDASWSDLIPLEEFS